jgi:S-adenosylmethionine-diacylglycerol 3-amino-3-carboxypropyl transferase
MGTEAAARADFTIIRYAQAWEDADILLEGLAIAPGDVCVSIASAGDNALAMLARSPAKVVALDVNRAQLACMELRITAYGLLEHSELLELIGSAPSNRRRSLYEKCRGQLSPGTRDFWDRQQVEHGVGALGKFERYFRSFRQHVMPLIHSRQTIDRLLAGGELDARRKFYDQTWNTWRWRLLFKIFFSRFVMGRLGRDPEFFRYVEGSVADRILKRTRHALVELDPAANPYLQWILTGQHRTALPFALRPQNFDLIRANLDRVELRQQSLEMFLESAPHESIDRFNLSDIFEYMSETNYHRLLDALTRSARRGGRLAYWNMLAPRRRPDAMSDRLRPLAGLAEALHARDKAFFYSAFIVEEVL